MFGSLMKLAVEYVRKQFGLEDDAGSVQPNPRPPRSTSQPASSVQTHRPVQAPRPQQPLQTPQEANPVERPASLTAAPAAARPAPSTGSAKPAGKTRSRRRRRPARLSEAPGPRPKFRIVEPTAEKASEEGETVLAKIGENPRLHLPDFGKEEHYELLSNDADGIDSRFDEDEYENELLMGFDFGTSNVKVVVVEPGTRTLAVPFVKASGIDAYLLPTILYEADDGTWTLEPTGRIVSKSIKLDFKNKPDDEGVQLRAAGFLALAIRHARAWLYTSNPHEFLNGLSWEVIMGYPSTEDDEESRGLWRELIYRSWHLAGVDGPVTPDAARRILEADESELDVPIDYFRAQPEVLAEAHAFIRNRPREAAGEGVYYTIVDVGSGTLDISSFAWSQHALNGTWHLTPFITSVDWLGTTDTHHKRLRWLRTGLRHSLGNARLQPHKEQIVRWIGEIDENLRHSLRVKLPDDVRHYYSGMNFKRLSTKERDLSNAIFNHLFHNRYHCHVDKHISREVVSQMKVLLCGGGARARFYQAALSKEDPRYSNYTWVRPVIENLNPIRAFGRDGLPVPIRPEDHDRLLVAYGLAILEDYTVMSSEGEMRELPMAKEIENPLTDKSIV